MSETQGPWVLVRDPCSKCKSTGKVPNLDPFPLRGAPNQVNCQRCGGDGKEKVPGMHLSRNLKNCSLPGNRASVLMFSVLP
jgi:DnaJ-class molecular chaperone